MYSANNKSTHPVRGSFGHRPNYSHGEQGTSRGFHSFGNQQPQHAISTFENHNAPTIFYRGIYKDGPDGPDLPVQYSVLESEADKPPATKQKSFYNARGNFARGSRGGRGISNKKYHNSNLGRMANCKSNDSNHANFDRETSQSKNKNNDYKQDTFSRDNHNTTTNNSSTFTIPLDLKNHSKFTINDKENTIDSNAILEGNRRQLFNSRKSGNVKKPIQNETEAQPLIPITEEDKEIFGEDIRNKLAAQKLPRRHAPNGFYPIVREVSDILKEDENHADNYTNIFEEDDEIKMEGFPINERPELMKTWNHPKLQKIILDNIADAKYPAPRKVQGYAIPLALNGYDLALQAETGSGKTLAYLIPIVSRCITDKSEKKIPFKPLHPNAIILTPSRELAQQCYEQALKLVKNTNITVARAYGEFSIIRNKEELSKGCDILFTTPGRFADFVAQNFIALRQVHFLVFDESDRLLSNNFKKTIDRTLFGSCTKMPKEHQTLFYSATFDTYGLALANEYMRPKKMVILKNQVTVPSRKCDQEFKIIAKNERFDALVSYFNTEQTKVQENHGNISPTIIFCRRGTDCEKIAIALELKGYPTVAISGRHAQDLREKDLCNFREKAIKILCVTDLLSRGLDIKDVDVVINYEMPPSFETYIHRVGRAGRIRRGKCISFIQPETDAIILNEIKNAMEQASRKIPPSLVDAINISNTNAISSIPTDIKEKLESTTNCLTVGTQDKKKDNVESKATEIDTSKNNKLKKEDNHYVDDGW